MSFLNLIFENTPTTINVNNVLMVSYKEEERLLTIEFTNGKVTTLTGDEADRLWEIFSYEPEPEEEEDEEEVDEFEDIYEGIASIENLLKHNAITNDREIWQLQDRVESLDKRWDSKKKKELGGKLKEVTARVKELYDEVEVACEIHKIEEALTASIVNSQAAKSLLGTLTDAEKLLKKRKKLTDELQHILRVARERIAWHRAKKKLDEAGVAEAGGGTAKRDRLRREAAVLLKQDWAVIFPRETVPEIDNSDRSTML